MKHTTCRWAAALSFALGLTACQGGPTFGTEGVGGAGGRESDAAAAGTQWDSDDRNWGAASPTPAPAAGENAPAAAGAAVPPERPQPLPPPTVVPADKQPALGGGTTDETLTPEQIRDAVRDYADHYRDKLATVCDQVAAAADDPVVRRRALRLKVDGATAAYDIAVDPSPPRAMLNMLVMLSLQVNTAERHGPPLFGAASGPRLLAAARELQERAFTLAARVMTVPQRQELLTLCDRWTADNPDEVNIWYVRLNSLPGVRAGGGVMDAMDQLTNLPGKFLGKFIPFSEAGESVSAATDLAERMSWLGPRLMIVAQWRAELLVADTLTNPEVGDALKLGNRVAAVAESLPETLANEREAVFRNLVENRETLAELAGAGLGITAQANQLVGGADRILERVQAMQGEPDPDAAPGRPFDITEYTATLTAAQGTLTEANALVGDAEALIEPQRLETTVAAAVAPVVPLIWLGGGVLAGAIALGGGIVVLLVKFVPRRG